MLTEDCFCGHEASQPSPRLIAELRLALGGLLSAGARIAKSGTDDYDDEPEVIAARAAIAKAALS